MICGSGGSKSRLAKVAGAEQAGQMRDQKLHAVVARSKFRSQNVQNTPGPDHFWKLRCRKSARRCGAKHISKSKCTKHTMFGPLLEVAMSKKCTALWHEAHFEVKMYKAHHVRTTLGSCDVEKVHVVVGRSTFRCQKCKKLWGTEHFWTFRCFCVAGARDCGPCQKWAKHEGFVAFAKTMAGVGHVKRICKDAFSVAGAIQETCSSELLGGPGADFLRRVAFWSIRSYQIFRFAEMILRDRCSTSYDPVSLFRGRRSSLGGVEKSQNSLVRGRQLCTQLSIFEGSLAELKKWGSLAELLRFSRERLRRVLRKKAAVILDLHTFTPADLDLHTFTPADLDLHTFTPADLHLHTFTSADLHLHTFTPADLDLQTFTPADLDLHTFTPADLDLHTLTSADLDLHTFTPADLDLHTLTSADRGCEDLDLHTLTSADLHLHTLTPADLDLHILTPADLDLHTLTSADLDLHTLTPADLHHHTLTPADLDLHTFTSADLLSLFFYSLLRRGRCRRSATKRNPFARNGRWTSKT